MVRRTKHAPVYLVESRTGFFSGRFTRETYEDYKKNLPGSCVEAYCYEQNFKRLDRAGELQRKRTNRAANRAGIQPESAPESLFTNRRIPSR